LGIDAIDKKILEILQSNPEASQKEIASRIKLSQPSVSARIKKLKKNGLLAHVVGIDIKKAGLHVGKIEVKEIDEKFRNCPRILSILETNDGYIVFVVSEDYPSMEYFVRKNFGEKIKIILDANPNFVLPLKLNKNGCSNDCVKCPYYVNQRCSGCPFSPYYKGNLLKVKRKK